MKQSLTFSLSISLMSVSLSSQPGCAGLVTTNADAGALEGNARNPREVDGTTNTSSLPLTVSGVSNACRCAAGLPLPGGVNAILHRRWMAD